ncbi:MAG: hypothetical protein FXF47_01875 [Candidatus Mcinerneyibacterium aminivorans]|uniref:DNA replication and repair protein RecF n=1 Tax=Candidatus Mcinerneyibacterium aminivorans TaxID=2703815 RepID=A0A5D0MIU0_9BACT|nr:MAG: hypothetical protein FXF47_01875 [Candidatus Mcinerneyibacterium aminivorans]
MVYFYQNEIRRFFDKYIQLFFGDYRRNLLKYKKILRERNAILKEKNPSKKEIKIWDDFFIKYSGKIISDRKQFVKKLNGSINKYYQKIFSEKFDIKIDYRTNFEKEKFRKNLNRDIKKQTTQIGPHRDKYKIIFNNKQLKASASQGQMKSFIMSFILVLTEKLSKNGSEDVVLLMDDVFAELDLERKNKIFKIINDFDLQCFFTVVEKDFFENKIENFIKIDDGRIIQ